MSIWLTVFLYVWAAGISFLVGYIRGHDRGVKNTEERWSDAVAIKEDREKCPMYDPQCSRNPHRFNHFKTI